MKKMHGFDGVFDSQKLFRLILEAMSNPLRTVDITEFKEKFSGENGGVLALAFTLLDNETSFSTCENRALSEEIISLTLAKRETAENADFIFVTEISDLEDVINNAKCGTLADPHKSATVIVKLLANERKNITFAGPGINGSVTAEVDGDVERALELRDGRFFEYPEGLDFIFIAENGKNCNLFAIPRLVNIRKEAG